MVPSRYNVSIWQGDSWQQDFNILENAVPVDFTGASAAVQIRAKAADATPALELTTAPAGGITIAGNTITVDKVIGLAAGTYVYELTVVFAAGTVKTYLAGQFIILTDGSKL